MNKRQAKKYSKKINNTRRIKIKTAHVKRRGAHNKYYISIKLKPQPQIKGLNDFKKERYTRGIFDTFGELTGYKRAAQSAGNRIENMHPGFFDTYSKLGTKLLDFIWDLYASYHRASFLYDANEDYVDEQQYEFLIDVLDEQLTYLGE